MAHVPVVCTLTPAEREAYNEKGLPRLLRAAPERSELSTGYRFRFEHEPGLLVRIAEAIQRERECCRFFRFQLSLEPDLGSITLDVSGHAEAKAFLGDLTRQG
jgi:hypothetical protein